LILSFALELFNRYTDLIKTPTLKSRKLRGDFTSSEGVTEVTRDEFEIREGPRRSSNSRLETAPQAQAGPTAGKIFSQLEAADKTLISFPRSLISSNNRQNNPD